MPFRAHRPDQEIADQSGDQHRTEDVHGGVVELVGLDAGRKLELADVVHDDRTDDAGCRPRCQQTSMNGAHELGVEHVGEIGRHGGEATTIHRQDGGEAEHEQELRAHRRECRRQCIECDAEKEERVVGGFAADLV